jgi:hypothetical protein
VVINVSVEEKSPSSPGTATGSAYAEPAAAAEKPATDPARERARKRLDDRRGLGTHLFVYLVTNAFLVGTWLATGAGYFWPGWVLGGWGVAIALHGWDYYWRWRRPITEADVDAEVRRTRRR